MEGVLYEYNDVETHGEKRSNLAECSMSSGEILAGISHALCYGVLRMAIEGRSVLGHKNLELHGIFEVLATNRLIE